MANNQKKYRHIGTVEVFEQEPPKKPDYGWVWGLLTFIGIIFLLSKCAG